MFDRPILFYSEYCIHSTNFINALMKHQALYENFIRISIDVDVNTRQRPKVFYDIQTELNVKIVEVPTIITPGPEYVLTGADAFDWLEFQTNKLKEESKQIEGFNNMEMGSFSDSYSTYGSSDLYDAKEQTFKFIGKADDRIETPPETSSGVSKDDYARKQQEREAFDNSKSHQGQQGQQGQQIQQGRQRQQPYQRQNEYPNKNQNDNKKYGGSDKQREIDDKLQRMITERESLGQVIRRT
jgi:hypothetical protein